ncbi:hypothetical protein [Streptomyces sp. NPDC051561]|uniref:hypothetical protein n=1 Tax=Streptomyces sp. NPDC051561 TaxID=3365658 RepID=UPI0037A92B7D
MRTSSTVRAPRSTPRKWQLTGAACLLLAAVAGCGTVRVQTGTPAPTETDPLPRMRQVAQAWQGTKALAAVRDGFHPLDRFSTAVPKGGLRSSADRTAHLKGAYTAAPGLPTNLPAGTVTWRDGTRRTATALSAEAAVALLGEGDNPPDGGHTLKVTGARLGETEVATGRGPARVPAWLFTVAGYDSPFGYPAVAPDEFPRSPVAPLPWEPGSGTAAQGPGSVRIEGRVLSVAHTHGSCDGPGVVRALETEGTVVLAVSVRPRKEGLEPGTACDMALRVSRATVELKRPVGDRVLLDAQRGLPVQQSTDPT